ARPRPRPRSRSRIRLYFASPRSSAAWYGWRSPVIETMSTRAQVGDLYVVRSKRFDLWCTLQIIEVAERVSVVALPGMLAQKPPLADAPRGRAFGSSYYFFAGNPQLPRCTLRLEQLEAEAKKIG